jgi:hypothetical protein
MTKIRCFLVVLLGGIILISFFYLPVDRTNIGSVNSFPTPSSDAIPKSNIEWLTTRQRFDKGMLKNFKVEYTIQGKLVSVEEETGKIEGLEDYYVGEEGKYVYGAKLTLDHLGNRKTIYFSNKRLSIIKLYKYDKLLNKYISIQLKELMPGKKIEVTEVVDLAISNINDENVLSLNIYQLE